MIDPVNEFADKLEDKQVPMTSARQIT